MDEERNLISRKSFDSPYLDDLFSVFSILSVDSTIYNNRKTLEVCQQNVCKYCDMLDGKFSVPLFPSVALHDLYRKTFLKHFSLIELPPLSYSLLFRINKYPGMCFIYILSIDML